MPRVWPDPRDNEPDSRAWLYAATLAVLATVGFSLANWWRAFVGE